MCVWEKGLAKAICSIVRLSHYPKLAWLYRKNILDVYYTLFLPGVYFSREIRISCFRTGSHFVQVVYIHRKSKFLSFMLGSKAMNEWFPEHWNSKERGIGWVRTGFRFQLWYVPAVRAFISSCVNVNNTHLMEFKEKKIQESYLSHYVIHI